MPSYAYRCAEHGRFEVRAPLAQAPLHPQCPDCAAPGRRVYSTGRQRTGATAFFPAADRSVGGAEHPAAPGTRPRRRPTSLAG